MHWKRIWCKHEWKVFSGFWIMIRFISRRAAPTSHVDNMIMNKSSWTAAKWTLWWDCVCPLQLSRSGFPFQTKEKLSLSVFFFHKIREGFTTSKLKETLEIICHISAIKRWQAAWSLFLSCVLILSQTYSQQRCVSHPGDSRSVREEAKMNTNITLKYHLVCLCPIETLSGACKHTRIGQLVGLTIGAKLTLASTDVNKHV